jgi:EAL domain-containing protein (putative c-di-GMP-specific phosphodiesterase class I)
MFNQTLLKTLISISDVLGCKLVAEGVDTHETLAFLREHACPYYQGFLFHKGVKEEGALNLYKKHRRVKDL